MKSMILIFAVLLSLNFVLAGACSLDASLINQDPYPAVQGDYVKLVFQLNGINDPGCGIVTFTLLEKYPIVFDPNSKQTTMVNAGTFTRDNPSFLMIPYKVRVDENALDGANPIEVSFSKNSQTPQETSFLKQFELEVKDVRTNFEVLIKNYDLLTNTLTLEVLNVGDSNVAALTLEIPPQENIKVKGSNINILGDIDSNEYTTTDFEATSEGGKIKVNIKYSDEAGIRRETSQTVFFDPDYFNGRKVNEKNPSWGLYISILVILSILGYFFYRRHKKKRHHEMTHKHAYDGKR